MAGTRSLTRKITSLKNMQKVMGAMNMIAANKLRKLLKPYDALVAFDRTLRTMVLTARAALADSTHPAVTGYPRTARIHVVMFTADKGLCGSHNSAVQHEALATAGRFGADGAACTFSCIGKKGGEYCRRHGLDVTYGTDINPRVLSDERLRELAARLVRDFDRGVHHEIHLMYNFFISTLRHETKVIRHLPLPVPPEEERTRGISGTVEPDENRFIPQALELYLYWSLKTAMMHSLVCEQAAKMTAMENATNNSADMIQRYAKLRNKARQAVITRELTEIAAGMEALET